MPCSSRGVDTGGGGIGAHAPHNFSVPPGAPPPSHKKVMHTYFLIPNIARV